MVSVGSFKADDLVALAIMAAVVVSASLVVFITCLYWFRREQNRMKKDILSSIALAGREPEGIFLTGNDASVHGDALRGWENHRQR